MEIFGNTEAALVGVFMSQGLERPRLDRRLHALFGTDVKSESRLAESGAGVRFTGIELRRTRSEERVEFLLEALGGFRIVCIAGQAPDRAVARAKDRPKISYLQ